MGNTVQYSNYAEKLLVDDRSILEISFEEVMLPEDEQAALFDHSNFSIFM